MSDVAFECSDPFEISMTYEPYSLDPEYIKPNSTFIDTIDLDGVDRILDLACGIGTLSKLLMARKPSLSIVGLDLSFEGLVVTRGNFVDQGVFRAVADHGANVDAGQVSLVCSSADTIPLHDNQVDLVSMGHSIHMLPDPDALLAEVSRVLKPGGTFLFNTSFYAGTFVQDTESIYHDWTMEAIRYIRAKGEVLRAAGKPGIKRKRGTVAAAFSNAWPSPDEWAERLERHGFSAQSNIRTVKLTRRSFESIAAYGGFSKVILSGYPVEEACEALMAAVGPTFDKYEIDDVPRHWLEVVAMKDA